MGGFTISMTSNEQELLGKTGAKKTRVRTAIDQAVEYTAMFIQHDEKANVRVDTGAGKRSIIRVKEGEMSQTIFPTAPYLITQEKGRGLVYPIKKHALWWEGLIHPVDVAGPVKAKPFVRPAYIKGNLVFHTLIKVKIDSAMKG